MIQKVKDKQSSPVKPIVLPARDSAYRAERVDRFAQFEKLTRFLDDAIKVPGTNMRIGWDSLIGIVPGLGDVVSTALSGYLIYQAKQLGASNWVLARMAGNVGLDFLIGAVPVVGDVFDAFFKSNRRNSQLLKKHLDRHNAG
ncbi:DUF4112 domain-containing protein [Gimesia maris]|uniref:DUF4112 domain-containing protein n=1 Tax=Gimesia maris TaxID=122 RepID=A0ABX5YUX1_9PLAN|nr:DUF4112 domain-containing protein [Gimesia maris]EDL61482.1 hypothetical protein PM8797T_13298 [Gimesia maris DSM 8797]QDU17419.1 hypothetical protein CA11_52610 [Gimesia maris]QEG19483.1 hypothetical protein GmarT_53830 [Gimesia maris]QGQ27672.1 DUF4112 domain-containing protein [Gimesia maris]